MAAPAFPAWLGGAVPPARSAAAPPAFLSPQSVVTDCVTACKGITCAGGGRCGYNPDFGGCGCVYV